MYLNYINGTGHAHLFEKRNKFCAFGTGESENPLKKIEVCESFWISKCTNQTVKQAEERKNSERDRQVNSNVEVRKAILARLDAHPFIESILNKWFSISREIRLFA